MCRYKALGPDTLALDVRVGKAFFKPATAGITGITMELAIPPYNSVFFPPLGAPNPFMDAGQTYSNDCIIAIDPGSISHVPGCIAVLNEASHKIVLLIRNVSGTNLNASTVGVVGFFGQSRSKSSRRDRGIDRPLEPGPLPDPAPVPPNH